MVKIKGQVVVVENGIILPMYYVAFCLFLSMIFPTTFQTERMLVMAVFLLFSIPKCHKTFYVSKYVLHSWLFCYAISLFFVGYGIINGCPGAIAYTSILLIYPILFLYVIGCIKTYNTILTLQQTVIYGGAVISSIILLILFNAAFLHIGIIGNIGDFFGFNFGMESGVISFSAPMEDTSLYIFASAFSFYFISQDGYILIKKSILIYTIIVSLAVVVASQTRSFWLLSMLTPLFYVVLMSRIKLSSNLFRGKNIVFVCFIIILLLYCLINVFDIELLIDKFASSFDFNTDDSNYERAMQFESLYKDFVDSPLIGKGIGWASAYVRSERPWEYEMMYNYLLACCGIIGFICFFIPTVSIYIKSFAMLKNNHEMVPLLIPQLLGLLLMLFASETNPFIFKFDFMWMLYLPVASINIMSRKAVANG